MRAAIIIFIFITLCLISGQVLCFRVFGCTGGSLMFKCLYKKHNDQFKEKYFCRDESCKTGIRSETQKRWVYNGRLALYDDENSRFFTVFIRNLSREDDGKYTCGNSQTWSRDVELVVNNEPHCGTSVIQDGYIGQTITVHCEYDDTFKTHTKVFYSLNEDPVHVMNSSRSSSPSSPSSEEKFILSDSDNDHFTVTIRDISAADDRVYLCGVERDGSDDRPSSVTHMTFVKEIHLNVSSQMTSVQVQAYSSKSVFITCTFPQEFKENEKFIQKDSAQKILINGQNQWKDRNNVQMFDDSSEGLLKVFISDLTTTDEGTYRCGVNINDDDLFTEVRLTVNPGDRFRALSNTSAIIGETVKLTCSFPEKHNETSRHFCKENKKKICESISSSEKKRFEFSVSSAGVFTVSISAVSLRDAGVYWCGAETRHTHLTSVSLTNRHKLTPTMVGREGGSSEIRCPYDEKYSTEVKHLCKGKCFTPDAQTIIQSDEDHVKKTRISVKDETELNLLTVTLSDLRAEDAGIYWCAVKDAFNLPTELMILMKDAITHEASVGGSASISCKYVRKDSSLQRSFCRGDQPNICVQNGVRVSSHMSTNGRFSLTDETSAEVFTVNITNLTAEDSGKYWCAEEDSGSFVFTEVHLHVIGETPSPERESQDKENSGAVVIVAVSVGLILLAVCFVLVLLKIKYNRKHGIISSSDRRETGDHEVAQEEIQDSDPASTPLDPSVQPPTNPSDELLYASVSFQKHEESLSDATVSFSKDRIHSDYASVKHSRTPH